MAENTKLQTAVTSAAVSGPVRGFFAGAALLGRGFGMWATSPRLMFLGAVPALVVGALYATAFVMLLLNLEPIAGWLTPFAAGWDEPWRTTARITVGVAALGIVVLVLVYTFVAITLAVGDPFYERIWRQVENRLGDAPDDSTEPFWRSATRGIGDGLRMLLATAVTGLALFAFGFIPLVGQTLVPVTAVFCGGWFLAVELTGFAFDARGLSLRERRRMLRGRRAPALGFGVVTYLLFLVPFAAVVVMPAAVAGATLLSRSALDEGAVRAPAVSAG
ncbi:EI24 domain-containing protein [Glaciibacter sp. 2TAF33]|uniref:EI24 domain-containing protein n=1 Tax=Glaciibacter sp. 2TAF33 TaxID=3233015 RepID=UPI003F92C2CD